MPGAQRLKGEPVQTPYEFDATDANGAQLTVRFNFNNNTRMLNNVNLHRDQGCLFTQIFLGVGPDGTPNSSPLQFTHTGQVDVVFAGPALDALGFATIEDVLNTGQITAG